MEKQSHNDSSSEQYEINSLDGHYILQLNLPGFIKQLRIGVCSEILKIIF